MTLDDLRRVLDDAARGRFPDPDWRLDVAPSPPPAAAAVLAFTGYHVIAADIDGDEVAAQLDPDDIAAPFNPRLLAWLGDRLGARVGHVDVALAALGTGDDDGWLVPTAEPPDNQRVQRAQRLRRRLRYFRPPEDGAVVVLGEGLAGRLELSMEIDGEDARNAGLGTRLVRSARRLVPEDEVLFASAAPGNARSLRVLLAAGFRPIGAECIFSRPLTPHRSVAAS